VPWISDHIKELNNARPKQPFFFLKPPSSILLPKSGPFLKPKGVQCHYEVELGLVIGKNTRDLKAGDEKGWLDAIEGTFSQHCTFETQNADHGDLSVGYLLAIDMTARNVQDEAKSKGLPWSIAKGFDTFMPISQFIPKQMIPDPHNVKLWLSINDQIKQNDNTELMLFRIPRQLSEISKVMTLEKGDIVLTGTPKGVGPVATGDVMKAGLSVGGQEISEGNIEVVVEDSPSSYEFKET
jgi:acylpyruvate hydrolase